MDKEDSYLEGAAAGYRRVVFHQPEFSASGISITCEVRNVNSQVWPPYKFDFEQVSPGDSDVTALACQKNLYQVVRA